MCCWRVQKPIRIETPIVPRECALCLEFIERRMAVCLRCGQGMHKHCLDKWKLQCKLKELAFTCPHCRIEF